MKKYSIIFYTFFFLTTSISAEVFIRLNQAGYLPVRPKSLVLISDTDLKDQKWVIQKNNTKTLEGVVPSSSSGIGIHTSHAFNYIIDFSSLETPGLYTFSVGESTADIKIAAHPYSALITDALRHLRTARSGSDKAFNHSFSHGGDSAALVHFIDGAPSAGLWKAAKPHQTVDARGGWYDAGDYIKFTLTIATTTYYLLEAWESNPKAFTRVISTSALPDVLDEALHGLTYLMKCHPQKDLFIIQVGNGDDHNQGNRMPEQDQLDGKRPALCAISPVHMGITSAALAKGARVFKGIGETEIADKFINKAISIMQRAGETDALSTAAFEKDETNDFYRDQTLDDNMALGALEVFNYTFEKTWLDLAIKLAPSSEHWLGWGTYNFTVNYALQQHYESSETAAREDIDYFTKNMDPVWGIPLSYTWASLLNWNAAGAACGSWNLKNPDPKAEKQHLLMVDLLFGRNNWGVSFMATTRLDNSVRNVYSQIYTLTEAFPCGAVALGPGDIKTHNEMQQYFGTPPQSPLSRFNTKAAVFYDWNKDFMTMETVTMSQAYALWLLALGSNRSEQAPADSSLPPDPKNKIDIGMSWKVPIDNVSWYLYSDKDEQGNSTAEWTDNSGYEALLTPKEGIEYPYAGFGFSLPKSKENLSSYDGFTIYGNFQNSFSFRVELAMKSITDYNYHGKALLGKGEAEYSFLFSELQRDWGEALQFDPSAIDGMNINYTNTKSATMARVDSIVFFSYTKSNTGNILRPAKPFQINRTWIRDGQNFMWMGNTRVLLVLCDLKGRVLWRGMALPMQKISFPKSRGMQILRTSDRRLLDHWVWY